MDKSFTVTSGALSSAVKYAAQWLTPKPVEPIHGGLLFTVADGNLSVSGFNENVTARATVPVDGPASGEFVVAGRLIDALVGTFPNKPITFEQVDAVVSVTAPRFSATLPAMHAQDYPTLPGQAARIGSIDGTALADAVHRVGSAASRDTSKRIAFCGIHIAFGDESGAPLTVTATDAYQAARQSVDWAPAGGQSPPADALVLASVLVDGVDAFVGPDEVVIGQQKGSFSLTTPTRSLVTRMLPVTDFPATGMAPLFGTPTTARATVKVKDLAQPLKRADLLRGKGPDSVRLGFTSGLITVAVASEMSGGDEEIDVEYEGPDTTILMRSSLLHGVLAAVPGGVAHLDFIPGTYRPVVVNAPADPTWRHIVVPLRSSDA